MYYQSILIHSNSFHKIIFMVACIGHFILFLPSLNDSSSDTWSYEILTHLRDSCALPKLKKKHKQKTLRITLLNRWQHYTKINKYGASKQ